MEAETIADCTLRRFLSSQFGKSLSRIDMISLSASGTHKSVTSNLGYSHIRACLAACGRPLTNAESIKLCRAFGIDSAELEANKGSIVRPPEID